MKICFVLPKITISCGTQLTISIWEVKKKLALLSHAFRPFVRKIQITRVYHARIDLVAATADTAMKPSSSSSPAIFPLKFYNERRGIRRSLFSILTSFHCVLRDSNSSSFCCRQKREGQLEFLPKSESLDDTSLGPFKKKSLLL